MCKVMGIVNVTPDSFSDGGMYCKPEEALRRIRNLAAEGADIIDLGAESTRPGATPVPWEEEWRRLEPVLKGLSSVLPADIPVSIDTYHPETAKLALSAGAGMINCVYGEQVPEMLGICAREDAEIVIPANSLATVSRTDLSAVSFYIDPMIGFGTTRDEDLDLLRRIPDMSKLGRVLIGVSRKRIVRKLAMGDESAAARRLGNRVGKLLGANIALAVWSAINGASCVRVHDVAETVQALKVIGQMSVRQSDLPES